METTNKYRYMTLEERKRLGSMYLSGARPQDIAEQIGVTVATVYRELKRGYTGKYDKNMRPGYNPKLSQLRLNESLRRRGHHAERDGSATAARKRTDQRAGEGA